MYSYLRNQKDEFDEHSNHSPTAGATSLKINEVSSTAVRNSVTLWENWAWRKTAACNTKRRQNFCL
jgi:hypothetical protein